MSLQRGIRYATLSTLLTLSTFAAGLAAAPAASSDTIAALQVIQRDADAIAAGKYQGKALQAPAHEIGAKWSAVAPELAKNGAVLVETRMANASIIEFDKTWERSDQVRKSAKDVSSSVADLLDATKQSSGE